MYNWFVAFLAFLSFTTSAQDTWPLRWEVPIDAAATWDVDPAGNVYLFNNLSISKLDTAGKLLLTQSAKSLGEIAKIDAGNWLKIAVFSEEQQQICYLDNALALQPGCIDLSKLEINLAQLFSTSLQTDRIWVYDQPNSELQLITLRTNQRQVVQNLKALMELGTVTQLLEFQNTLYLADDKGQVVRFDNFGTFIGSDTYPASYVQPVERAMLYSRDNAIYTVSANGGGERLLFQATQISGPILQFTSSGKRIFISTATAFYCFERPSQQ